MKWFVHIEWTCETCGIVRLFERPVGKMLNSQPIKDWVYSFLIVRKGEHVTIRAALNMRLDVMRALVKEAKKQGIKQVQWERWKNGNIKIRQFNI